MSAQVRTNPVAAPEKALSAKNVPSTSPLTSLVAGGIAGSVEAAVTYPFEFAKTRAQLSGSTSSRNPFAVLIQTARTDGVPAIYTGCTALILGTALKAGVRFLSYDSIKRILADDSGRLSPSRGLVAGMFAGFVESVIAVTPTERIKTALIDDQRGARRFQSALHGARTFVAERGIRELYRGLVPTTVKQSATSAVRMGSYNIIKEKVGRYESLNQTIASFTAGALAGTITVYATQPFDTVKTRSQSTGGATISDALRDIYLSSGVRGFWSGSTMRLGRLMLSGGIVFAVYEKVVSLLS